MPVDSERLTEVAAFMNNKDSIHDGVTVQSASRSDQTAATTYSSSSRREKPTSIFSFLQRFRGRSRHILEDVTSLPSSPRSVRRPQKPRPRWESAESILSTATTNSFAFIPPSQVRGGPRLLHPAAEPVRTTTEGEPSTATPFTNRDNTVFLRRKYNLLGSDASLCPSERKRSLRNLYRNSIGNVENIRVDGAFYSDVSFSSFRRPTKPTGLIQRPKSEYSIPGEFSGSRRVYSHRPGKGRAPPPPVNGTNIVRTLSKSTSRKKRRAPLPPEVTNTSDKIEAVKVDVDHSTPKEKMEEEEVATKREEREIVVCNDSLKLEKGQLKANNRSLTMSSTNSSISSDPSIPVSPKPWYKRSSVRNSKKTSSKKKTPQQLLDEWILEAGLPRSSSFCNDRKTVVAPQTAEPGGNKRRSQISILANISELDREAAEIVQKERKKEHDMAASIDDKFYDCTPVLSRGTSWNKFVSSKEPNTPTKRHTSKDLISIINAVTNVTKISVNANFFKDSSILRPSSKQNCKPEKIAESTPHKLTITELNDTDKKPSLSCCSNSGQKETNTDIGPNLEVELIPETKSDLGNGGAPTKPLKPFSSWICPQCTLENPSWKFICEACNKWRPYSVNKINGRPTPLITPKEDLKLPQNREKLDRASLLEERDQIKQISNSIRKQVYDILTSGENIRNNLTRLKAPETAKTKGAIKSAPESVSIAERSENDLEETRKARLAFFSKNCLNDLNRNVETAKTASPKSGGTKNKYYNEEDRRKLREILKELKESLPNQTKPPEVDTNELVKQRSDSSVSALMKRNDKIEKFKDFSRVSNSSVGKKERVRSVEAASACGSQYAVAEQTNPKKLEERNEKPCVTEPLNSQTNASVIAKKISSSTKISSGEEPKCTISPRKAGDKQSQDPKGNHNKPSSNLNVNRLLQQLQTAIAGGQHHEAANIARELARLKVNCSMTRLGTPDLALDQQSKSVNIRVSLHIRRNSIQLAPIFFKFSSKGSINDLKKKVSGEYNMSSDKQVWMVRGKLIDDESASLEQLGAKENEVFALYLYSSSDKGSSSRVESAAGTDTGRLEHSNVDTRYPSYVLLDSRNEEKKSERISPTSEPSTKKVKSCDSSSKLQGISEKLQNEPVPTPSASSSSSSMKKEIKIENDENKNAPEVPAAAEGTDQASHVSKGRTQSLMIAKDHQEPRSPALVSVKVERAQNDEFSGENSPDWVCVRCTSVNSVAEENCTACTLPKVQQSLVPDGEIEKSAHYRELIVMDEREVCSNFMKFECPICFVECVRGEGAILKNCLHAFCRACLVQTIQHSFESEVKCPFRNEEYSCEGIIQEREIKALVTPEIYEFHLDRAMREAENRIQNSFHCKTPNCQGWCIFEDNVNEFHCPLCEKTNCLTCQVIHTGLNCKQYQEILDQEPETNADAHRTRIMLLDMLRNNEAMTCPTCNIILMKKWGCDWLRCTMCKTEICWVTRGLRWGPKGKGDTSGGCRCGVNGVKCHPMCSYCH